MAMNPTQLAQELQTATANLAKPDANATPDEVAAYSQAAQEIFAQVLIEHVKNNAEVSGDVQAGIAVRNFSNTLIGDTDTGTAKIDGQIS